MVHSKKSRYGLANLILTPINENMNENMKEKINSMNAWHKPIRSVKCMLNQYSIFKKPGE